MPETSPQIPAEFRQSNWNFEYIRQNRLPDQTINFLNAIEGKGFDLGEMLDDSELLNFAKIDKNNSAKAAEYLNLAKSLRVDFSWGQSNKAVEMANLSRTGLWTDDPFGLCIHLKRTTDEHSQFVSVARTSRVEVGCNWDIIQFQGQKMGKEAYNSTWSKFNWTSLLVFISEQVAAHINATQNSNYRLDISHVNLVRGDSDPRGLHYNTYKKILEFLSDDSTYSIPQKDNTQPTKAINQIEMNPRIQSALETILRPKYKSDLRSTLLSAASWVKTYLGKLK